MEDIAIVSETVADHEHVDSLLRSAFGGDLVASLVVALRMAAAPLAPISLIARDSAGSVVGHVMLTAGRLDAPRRLVDVMTLSPLAVVEHMRGRGLGAALMAAGLAEADRRGVPLVFVEGDPGYYSKRGLVAAGPLGFRRPSLRIPEAAFQVARLSAFQDWMTGTFVYSDTFWALDCVGLR